ncbi:hypothetical protein HPB48_000084 [Haemaphysalis longicornis]|uniref:Uncharacterized protein n=1 Tax=Haemaphysalis longicornis TaxID=44386 RepID=A0A9J6F956_HAELO|nr:hypothetical protein HPB48_000084 [Haemaphysalis longicornis]
MELTRVAAECQFKPLARLQRLGSPIVDAVVEGTLHDFWAELGEQLGVPLGITDAGEVNKALGLPECNTGANRRTTTQTSLSFRSRETLWGTGGSCPALATCGASG